MAKAKSCGPDCACHKKSRAFGAATWVAVLFAVAVVAVALWFSVKDRGKSVAPKVVAQKAWFPEPSFLLDHASDLKLTIAQRRHVEVTNRVWQLKRAAFNGQFQTRRTDANAVLADLKAGKSSSGDYRALVHDFNEARNKAWVEATRTLTSNQVLALDKLKNGQLPTRK